MRGLRTFVVVLAVSAMVAGGLAWWAFVQLGKPLPNDVQGMVVEVPNGSHLRGLASVLNEQGIIEQPGLWTAYGRVSGLSTRIRAGEYEIPSGATPMSLLQQFVDGNVFLHSVTIVEGWRFNQALAEIQNHPAIVKSNVNSETAMDQLGKLGVHPEGQLFPDTYYFPKGTSDVDVLQQAHEALEKQLQLAWDSRAEGLPLESAYEALTLASIVEKETALAAERPIISGVFVRRLEKGMRLQTDPTVIYGLGESFDGNLRRRDLNRDGPYNTYRRKGLPPSPIALVGEASLQAAVQPAPGDSLFFVATGDPDGSHYFSATVEEHNKAVQRYLAKLRSNR